MLQLDGKYRWTEYRDVPTAARVIEHAPQCSGKFLLFSYFLFETTSGELLISDVENTHTRMM
jgi:hypothetical protein